MIFKSRWFRILATVLGLVLFIGYFAFSTFLFAPHESDFEYDVSGLVPKGVDFFFAKAELIDDFGEFPQLAVANDMKDNASFQALLESPQWNDFKTERDLDTSLADLKAQVEQIPLGIAPLDVFGGEDLAIAGYFRGSAFADADWAAYGRVNWVGKMGEALLSRGWLAVDGTVTRSEGVTKLEGGQFARPHFVTRVQDVVIIGTSEELVASARDLSARSGVGSLLGSSDYADNVFQAKRHASRDELEVMVDVRDLLRNLGHEGELPDSNADAFVPSFLGKVFQIPNCKKLMGVIGLREGLQVDLQGDLISESITADQNSIYMRKGFGHDEVLKDIAMVAPANSALFVYLHGPIDILLRQALRSLEPATYNLLEQNIQQTGAYPSLDALIDHLSGGLANRLALIVAPNNFDSTDEAGKEPPNDGQVVFFTSIVVWYSDGGSRVEELRKLIGSNQRIFGIQGREPNSTGHFTNNIDGTLLHEFWSLMSPGTGVWCNFNRDIPGGNRTGRSYIFNNHNAAGVLSRTYSLGQSGGYPRLSERLDFQALLDESIPSANMMVWWNPQTSAETLLQQVDQKARSQVQSELSGAGMDWGPIRREIEQSILNTRWPGQSRSTLTPEQATEFDDLVNTALGQRRTELISQNIPALKADMTRNIEISQMMNAALIMLKLDPRNYHLSIRSVVPVD